MLAYVSKGRCREGNAKLPRLRRHGWRLFLLPGDVGGPLGFHYALDNAAWIAHVNGTEWEAGPFLDLVAQYGHGADFVVAPDIVGGGLRSLRLSERWLFKLPGRRLIAVQDGMSPADVAPLLGPTVGVFVGGTTPFKLATMAAWGLLARERRAWLHVGRVNTARRVALCAAAHADSFDGTSAMRFPKTINMLDAARRQPAFRW